MPGKHTGLIHNLRLIFTSLLSLVTVLLFQLTAASAHELRPAIMDVGVLEEAPNQLTINLTFSGEAFLADIDLSNVTDTDDSSNSGLYDELRAVPPDLLAGQIKSSFAALAEKFAVMSAGQPLSLRLVAVDVAEEDDLGLARDANLRLQSPLPEAGDAIAIQW